MKKLAPFLVFLLFLFAATSYDSVDNYQNIMHYYEEYSSYPIVHIYYNKHFKNSKQFQDFVEVIEETEYRNRDYSRYLLTDCDKVQEKQSQVCDDMRRTKDNHAIVGYYPSGGFIKYAGKKMQNPPASRHFKHAGDIYKVEELQRFVAEMVPNFYEDINSLAQFDQWLQPRYSPNLIFATRQDDIPLALSQLAVHYFLRFDMGFLSDLTEKVVAHLNITSFPALIVLKYNFELNTHQLYKYPGKDFSTGNYDEIKAFLQPLALKEPRNDLLFHKMKPPKDLGIQTTDSGAELNQLLDKTNGWTFIEQSNTKPTSLQSLKQKYGRFFEYIHFLNSSKEGESMALYDPQRKKPIPLRIGDIQWRPLTKEQFLTNMTALLRKNFVVMGVREKYSHFCTLALSTFFRDLTFCFIIKEQDYQATSKSLGQPFQYGFICYQRTVDGAQKVSGSSFNSDKYEEVYNTAEYQTRLKSKLIIDDFFQTPIKAIEGTQKISQLCNFPLKKCALLFSRSTKQDRTAYEYLKEVAKNFINEYLFFEIDLECNPHFEDQIQNLQKSSNGLAVYHPRQSSYVYLKAKLSRSTFQRFLDANLEDDKKLPHRSWKTEGISASNCKQAKTFNPTPSQAQQSEQDQVIQL